MRTSGGGAPSATVHVKAFNRSHGTWRSLGRLRLGARNGLFWDVITGSHAVRDFTISNRERHFHISHGRLVR